MAGELTNYFLENQSIEDTITNIGYGIGTASIYDRKMFEGIPFIIPNSYTSTYITSIVSTESKKNLTNVQKLNNTKKV